MSNGAAQISQQRQPTEQELMLQQQMAEQLKDQRYNEAVASLTDEERAALFDDYKGKGAALDRSLESAQGLQQTATPQGMQVGNQFFASSPWEHLGSIAQKGVGHYKGNQAEAGKKDLSEQQTLGTRSLAEALAAQEEMRRAQGAPTNQDTLGMV